MGVRDYISHAWNVIRNQESVLPKQGGATFGSYQPGKRISTRYSSSSLSRVVFNRIATDAAMVSINHCRVDSDGLIIETMPSKLQKALTLSSNEDQSSYTFFHDLVYSMCDEPAVAIVPIDVTSNINKGTFDVETMRVGKILQYKHEEVQVEVWDSEKGKFTSIWVPKSTTPILENPFQTILSASNSSLERLKRKMSLLDSRDEEIASGTFNLIVKLPYAIKGEAKTKQAATRRAELESQLKNNAYGIAYTGSDEDVIQLNRPIANDLADQVKYLRSEFYNQIGLTENVFNGTASEAEMNNYFARSIDPVLTTICLELKRKWLTPTALTQGQSIEYIRDPFKLIPMSQIATIADTVTRNSIGTPNEMRRPLGLKKSNDPEADKLYNRNVSVDNRDGIPETQTGTLGPEGGVPASDAPETVSQNGGDLKSFYLS